MSWNWDMLWPILFIVAMTIAIVLKQRHEHGGHRTRSGNAQAANRNTFWTRVRRAMSWRPSVLHGLVTIVLACLIVWLVARDANMGNKPQDPPDTVTVEQDPNSLYQKVAYFTIHHRWWKVNDYMKQYPWFTSAGGTGLARFSTGGAIVEMKIGEHGGSFMYGPGYPERPFTMNELKAAQIRTVKETGASEAYAYFRLLRPDWEELAAQR